MFSRSPHWRFWRQHDPRGYPPEGRAHQAASSDASSAPSNQDSRSQNPPAGFIDVPEATHSADFFQESAQQLPSQEHFRVGGVSGYGESTGPRLVGSGMLLGQEGGWYGIHEDPLTYPRLGFVGHFRGHGPKDYERTAERLREIICERLTDDPVIDARDISVQVVGNTVTLEGTVPHRGMKYRAEDVVANSGVDDVINHLRVLRP